MLDSPEFHRAARIRGLEISEIVQISERAAARKALGHDVVALSTGEPDFPTPEAVIAAAHKAATDGKTRYTPTLGTAELRAAIAADAKARPDQVIVSCGAKQVIANAMLATLEAGDEVVMPAPFWTSYADIVRMAGGSPVIVSCAMADGFKLTPAALEAALTPRTRWLMLNAPSNPSGAIYSPAELSALEAVLLRHPQVWVLSDEIYEHLNFIPFHRLADVAPDLRGRLLTVNGVSKAWSMTGWRIGWGIGPVDLIRAMGAVQGQVTSGACSIAQAAATAALTGGTEVLDVRRDAMRARRDLVVSALDAMPGIECAAPDGAFYVFPRITGAMQAQGHATDAAFCDWLLAEHDLALVPGRAFGLPGHLRLSFAYAESELQTGLDRLARALNGDT
ncbi:pyridoxal phosphate-dependent aminotransferase [Pseudotabrizicola algicola]|uniref:Aminotransferase n=1 Tax=Pseudotabrizicola algicola TaxID=2709381 RepID=A0A6B3RT23_9RHOB|nr:pyridoxal phosphate-dependent aminotransferase [Pseudotabrizicola algicola]NEX47918.1 pyridoxal phosphate-dependent aminotransferase [Pseudotabrizicola algicola]